MPMDDVPEKPTENTASTNDDLATSVVPAGGNRMKEPRYMHPFRGPRGHRLMQTVASGMHLGVRVAPRPNNGLDIWQPLQHPQDCIGVAVHPITCTPNM